MSRNNTVRENLPRVSTNTSAGHSNAGKDGPKATTQGVSVRIPGEANGGNFNREGQPYTHKAKVAGVHYLDHRTPAEPKAPATKKLSPTAAKKELFNRQFAAQVAANLPPVD